METEDGNESPKSSVFRDLLSLKNLSSGFNNVHNREISANDRNSPSLDEKNSEKAYYGSTQNSAMGNTLPVSFIFIIFLSVVKHHIAKDPD